MSTILLPALLLIALVAVAIGVVGRRRAPTGRAAAIGRTLVAGVVPTAAAIDLLERWRDRASRWRRSAAWPVVLASLVASLVLRQSLDVGVGAHPAWADPLLTGLVAVFLGSIAAELHHLRSRPSGARAVELAPRDVADYLPPHGRRRLVVLAVCALGVGGLTIVIAGEVPWLGVLALAITALVLLVQRGIAVRARPAVGTQLREADDAVRRLAVRSVDEAGAGAVLLLAAWQLAPVYSALDVPELLGVAMAVTQIAALVAAIVWWRRSDPNRLLPDVPGALAAEQPIEARS